MITMVIRIKIQEGKQADFEAAAVEQVKRVRQREPGTILYTLVRSQSDPTEYYFLEAYRDEAALNEHLADFEQHWRPTMQQFTARPSIVERFTPAEEVAGLAREGTWGKV